MRLKATSLGIKLSEYTPAQEADLLTYMMSIHDFELTSLLLMARNVGKPENFENLKAALTKMHSPWKEGESMKKLMKDEEELDELKRKYSFALNPYNLLTGGAVLEMRERNNNETKSQY